MLDAVTIGSALVDIFISSSDFELQKTGDGIFLCQMYGAKIEVDSFELCTGGGAGNVAVGLARAGLSVATVVELGKDFWSSVVVDDLARNHVDTEYVIKERKERTGGSVILVGSDGGRTVMVHRGASSLLDPEDIPERLFERTQLVHLSSIAGRKHTLDTICSYAKKHSVRLSWNPGSAELALLAGGDVKIEDVPASVFIVNREEWSQLESQERSVRSHIPEILVTDGKNGLTLIVQGKEAHIPGISNASVLDETGAGDGFIAGYMAARFYDHSPHEAVEWGLRNALGVISQIGAKAGLQSYSDLAKH